MCVIVEIENKNFLNIMFWTQEREKIVIRICVHVPRSPHRPRELSGKEDMNVSQNISET